MRTNSRARSLLLLAFSSAAAICLSTAVVAAGGNAPAPAARADDLPEADIAAARGQLVIRLVALAQWCHKAEIFEEADKLWTQILVLDPKNIDAHKGLGHARSTDGTWHETNRHVYKNRSTKPLAELPAKRAEAMKPFSEGLVARARAATDPAVRDLYVAAVLAVDPDDPTVHAYKGDAKDGDHWVLPETIAAREQRAKLRALVQTSMDGAPETKPEAIADKDPAPPFGWKSGLTTGAVRVFTTGPEEDARALARTCTAAATIAQSLFGAELALPPRFTFYLLEPAQKDAFLATFTAVGEEERARMAKLEGTGLPRRMDVALWNGNKARSIDAALRHTFGYLFGRGLGLTPSCGWVLEGFGLYLTREITGTRLTWFVAAEDAPPAGDAAALQARLLGQEANWMNEALTLLSGPHAPKISEVMKRDLAHLEVTDVVTGYALAAFLIEAHAGQVTEFVKRSAAGDDPEAITQSILSMSTDQLGQRLVRWLSERK